MKVILEMTKEEYENFERDEFTIREVAYDNMGDYIGSAKIIIKENEE